MNDVKYIDLKEFVDKGYLQEVNRQILHRLGLALEVKLDSHNGNTLVGIWDYRNDPEGIVFNDLTSDESCNKKQNVIEELLKKDEYRLKTLGFTIQPVGVEKCTNQ